MAFAKKVGMVLAYRQLAPTGRYEWLINPADFATTGGMVWRSTWNSSTIYEAGSVVTTGGIVYVAKVSNIGVQPPNSTSWDPITTAPTGGTGIQSITGTPSRIVVTGGPTPQVDISVLYTGQTSITTLGTITTGVWNGTTITVSKGGSGAVTLTGYLKGTGVTPFTASPTIPASDISSGQALTKADDTNVTITLGGTPSTALLAATSITAGWSGQLSILRGGSGNSTANAALNAFLPSQATHAGKVLTTDGTNTSWLATGGTGTVTSVGLTSSDLTVGGDPSPITAAGTFTLTLNTVPYNKGGTGQTSYAQGDFVYASAINTLAKRTIGATGDILSVAGSVPTWITTLTETHGGTNQTSYLQGDLIYASAVNTLAKLAIASGSPGNVLTIGGGNVPVWAAGGTGTVTSVGINMLNPVLFASGVITTAGLIDVGFADAAANLFLMGPSTGVPAQPGFRSMVTADIPNSVVTLAKMANIATASFLGRNTAGTGVPEVLSIATAQTMLGITPGTVTVGGGGTGATTFTAGLLVSPGGTTALTTVTGTAGVLPKWGSATLADSVLSDTGAGSIILTGPRFQIKSTEIFSASPLALYEFRGQYTSGAALSTMAIMELGKENVTDGNDAGYWSLQTKPSGSAITERIRVSSTGVVQVSNLTASRPVYTDASKNLVSATVLAVDGGTGKTVYQVGDILYADTTTSLVKLQATTNGYVLTLAGGVPTWNAPSVGSGTVTSVSVTTANGVSGSVATATTTPAITLTLGAITPTSVISVAAMTLGTSAGNANVLIVPNGTGRAVFGSAGNDIEITQGSNNSAILFNSANGRTSYLSSTVPSIYATAGGGSGVFGSAGSLVISPRTNAQREVDIATFDATNIIRVARFSSSGNVQIGDTITGVNLSGAGGLAVQSATAPASELGAIFTNGGLSAIKGLFLGRTNAALGTIRMAGNTSGYTDIQPSAAAGSWTMTLPTGAGTNGYVLQTNGSGVTSWVAQTGGGGTVTSVAVTSSDITVGGSPITGAGTITLALATPNNKAHFNASSADYTGLTTSFTLVDFGGDNFEISIPGSGTFRLEAHVQFEGVVATSDIFAMFDGVSDSDRSGHLVFQSFSQLVLSETVTQAGTTVYQVWAATDTATNNAVNRAGSWISYFKLTA